MGPSRWELSYGRMARCKSCYGFLAKTDSECYVCGDRIPGAPQRPWYSLLRFFSKPARPSPRFAVVRDRLLAAKTLEDEVD